MDPYVILGVDRNASQDEIKKAYRREAMKWHPDRSGNSAEARERFHQAAEAYKILSSKINGSVDGERASGSYSGGAREAFAPTFCAVRFRIDFC